MISALVVVLSALIAAWAIMATDAWFATHWLRHQCYLDVTTRNEAIAARVVAGVISIVLVVLVRPRAAKVAPRTWLMVAIAIVASLLFCELTLRWVRRSKPVAVAPPAVWLRHEGRQAFDVPIEGHVVHYETDEYGYRVRDASTRTDLRAPSIILAGESVAIGFGLEWDESPAGRLEHRMGMQVANLAESGLSSAGTMYRLRKELPKFEKPVAVVTFVVPTWLDRETDRRRWWIDWNEGPSLVAKPPVPESDSPLVRLWNAVFLYHDDHRFEVARESFRQITEVVRAKSAKPLFVFTECGARCRSHEFVKQELTRDLDAPYIWVDIPESDNLHGDMHPGPRGANTYAAAIERALAE